MFHLIETFSAEFWGYEPNSLGKILLRFTGTEKANLAAMNKTILEVNENVSVRESVTNAFGDAGYEAVLAAGGLEAVERFDSNEIDVLLLDIGLPYRRDWETYPHPARRYSEDPIMVITGRPGHFKSAWAAGAPSLMDKPHAAHQPVQRIQLLLAKSKQPDLYHSNGMHYHAAA
jgi:DNA-binding response OmpR family regulator